ncbi:MAG: hypothetical protein K2N55_05085 [Lachnospiraceae bacterium]|nr:hypothetical protein [Lachnospiraceae bacterium]
MIPASNESSDCLQAFGDCRKGQYTPSACGGVLTGMQKGAGYDYIDDFGGTFYCFSGIGAMLSSGGRSLKAVL